MFGREGLDVDQAGPHSAGERLDIGQVSAGTWSGPSGRRSVLPAAGLGPTSRGVLCALGWTLAAAPRARVSR